MYLNPLILDQKHVGFDELVRGNPTSAIRLIENLVKTCSANAETSRAAYRYMLLYATYSFPYLDLDYVTALCKTYQWAIEDAATQNLISERLNARWRQEYYQSLDQANATDSSKTIVPDVFINAEEIPTFCISIPRLADRKQRLAPMLNLFNWRHVEFRGVDALEISDVPWFIRFNATPGTMANIASHRDVWSHVASLDLPVAAIIEDDITLTGPLFINDMKQALVDVDIIFLNNRVVPDYSLLSQIPCGALTSSLVPTWFGCGTDGYMVTRRGVQKLLELFECVFAPADVQLMAHLAPEIRAPDLDECRLLRHTSLRLHSKRLYPFLVEHPAINYSTSVNRMLRSFSPGLWGSEDRS